MGSNKETVMDPGQLLVLFPLLSIVSGIPSFLKSSYLRCDDTACWHKTFDLEHSHVLHVPNSSLIISDWDWDWYEVTTESIIQSCSPSLSQYQMPTLTSSSVRIVVNMPRKVGLNLMEISLLLS